jgi:hypothetical protein
MLHSALKRRRSACSPPSSADDITSRPIRALPRRRLVTLQSTKPTLRPSLLQHRGQSPDPFLSSTETEISISEDDPCTALSDVESEVRAPSHHESVTPDRDGDEVDVALLASRSPASPTPEYRYREKGKAVDPEEYGGDRKRTRMWETSDNEADDEAEVKTLLGPGSGRRAGKRVS